MQATPNRQQKLSVDYAASTSDSFVDSAVAGFQFADTMKRNMVTTHELV